MAEKNGSNIMWLLIMAVIFIFILVFSMRRCARADENLFNQMGNKFLSGAELAVKSPGHLVEDPVAAKKACKAGFIGQTEAVGKGLIDGTFNAVNDAAQGIYKAGTFFIPCSAIDNTVLQIISGPENEKMVSDENGRPERAGGLQGAFKAFFKGVLIDSWMHPHKTIFGVKTVLGIDDVSDLKFSKDGVLPGAWHIATSPLNLIKINK